MDESNRADAMASDMPGRPAKFGEAAAYRRYLADDVLPFVAANYRTDPRRKIFAGHSYGGLLGIDILLTAPAMFDQYILSSPSLWFDRYLMRSRERDYAASHQDMPARVYFAVGGFEAVNPRSRNTRYAEPGEFDMVRDVQAFIGALHAHKYPNLHIDSTVFADEDRLTVAPAALTRGLMWALPPENGAAVRKR